MESKPIYTANNVQPFYNIHPGEIIKDELESRGLTQRQLAKELGISYSQLNEVLNAKRPLNSELALLLEAALGIDAQPLLRIQLDYNIQIAKTNKSFLERLASLRKVAAAL